MKSGADELLMSYNIMLAASASFMSPFGYTTNSLIYGPVKRANCSSCLLCLGYIAQTMPSLPSHLLQGGYKVKDFVYIGTPMQFILWIVTVFILSTTDTIPWWVSWLWLFGVFILVSLAFVFPSLVKSQMEKA